MDLKKLSVGLFKIDVEKTELWEFVNLRQKLTNVSVPQELDADCRQAMCQCWSGKGEPRSLLSRRLCPQRRADVQPKPQGRTVRAAGERQTKRGRTSDQRMAFSWFSEDKGDL